MKININVSWILVKSFLRIETPQVNNKTSTLYFYWKQDLTSALNGSFQASVFFLLKVQLVLTLLKLPLQLFNFPLIVRVYLGHDACQRDRGAAVRAGRAAAQPLAQAVVVVQVAADGHAHTLHARFVVFVTNWTNRCHVWTSLQFYISE